MLSTLELNKNISQIVAEQQPTLFFVLYALCFKFCALRTMKVE
jgi:hypothetical protein